MADKKALLIKMDPELHKKLKIKTAEKDENMTAVVLRLIEGYLGEVTNNSLETK